MLAYYRKLASPQARAMRDHIATQEDTMNKLGRGSIAIVIACAIFAFSMASWAQQPLKVGGAEPWVVRDQGSDASGLFVDLINAIAKDAGLKVDYESMIFADLIPALKD